MEAGGPLLNDSHARLNPFFSSTHHFFIQGYRFGSKPVAPSDCPDEVVADDFRSDLRFYGFDGSASDEVADEALQGVPP